MLPTYVTKVAKFFVVNHKVSSKQHELDTTQKEIVQYFRWLRVLSVNTKGIYLHMICSKIILPARNLDIWSYVVFQRKQSKSCTGALKGRYCLQILG